MVKLNKIGIPIMTLAMSFGMVTAVGAETVDQPTAKNLQIQVASTDNIVTKNEVVKRFKELFPKKFDSLTLNDFYLSTAHYYPEDETIRYDLSFSKLVQGKEIYGSATFRGDNLELESFHFEPTDKKGALFPAKVTKEDAQKLAEDFVKKFANGKQYKLDKNNDEYYYYYSNQLLTEPIQYYFTFTNTEENVEIADQKMEVAVLGNGDIVQYYQYSASGNGKNTFDKKDKLVNEKDVISKIKDNLNLQLQYQVNYDYRTDKNNVQLVYTPVTQHSGVNALTGQWLTNNGFSETLPQNPKVEKLVQQPLNPRQEGITVEDAKELAKKLLAIDSDKVKLRLDSIEEYTTREGKEIISISYSYEYRNGSYGTSIELDKQTGEIVNYYSVKNEVLREVGEDPSTDKKLTSDEALAQAINHLKEWVPSSLHEYIKPISEPTTDDEYGVYNFSFPRIVNGLVVSGNEISVAINFDGSLNSLYVNKLEVEEWPTTEDVLSKEAAEKIFNEALSLKLAYVKENYKAETKHYSLVYTPIFNEKSSTFLDAKSGKWTSPYGVKEYPIVSHNTAEEELNYLIQNNILEVKDSKFNAETTVKKGEALKVLIKSISYFYEGAYPQEEEAHQSFEDISPDNPYYQIVERAVSLGILDTEKPEFNSSANITREELAVWYIKALGLNQAAKHSEIYQLKGIKDAKDVAYTGYVALAEALDILPAEKGLFYPKKAVTYAELAVSTIQLAHKVYENGTSFRYY
ncbi:YcdB/YcdC domain-containing protein [Ureibacillus chungkukjangi]|uniref:S-layer family protein n=1 Tax=Ureibacillus chungkukjangi TaxID=1202712 RepID=A0A318TKG0_9BACL|nr:YcdB/YcdC domain-containing protein [Ureibacillus chungkukjangi]PYF04310.1 S-layer family protein [Ureibacillus chungkukjangi]